MSHTLVVDTGVVHCTKCYICGYWVQTGPVGRGGQSYLPRGIPLSPIAAPLRPRFGMGQERLEGNFSASETDSASPCRGGGGALH
jgi:hypothetical protein